MSNHAETQIANLLTTEAKSTPREPQETPTLVSGANPFYVPGYGASMPSLNGGPYRPAPYGYGNVPRQWKKTNPPKPFRAIELAALLFSIAIVDISLWSGDSFGSGGYAMALFFTALPITAFVTAKKKRVTTRFAVIAAMLGLVAIRSLYHPTVSSIFAGLGLLFAFVVSLRLRKSFAPELFSSVFSSIERFPSRVSASVRGARVLLEKTRMGRVSILPVLVPIGLALVFLGVFSLANPVVAHGVDALWTSFARIIGFPSPLRIAMWVVASFAAAVMLRPACVKTKIADELAAFDPAKTASVHLARNALLLMNVMFFAYNVLDLTVLVGGVPPKGVTTQEYAHQGAFWLTIALTLLTVVVGVLFRGALAKDPSAKFARRLAYAWMGQGFLLALGTYARIWMHVKYSGLSDLRIVGILGTSLVVVGMITVIAKLVRTRSFGWVLRRQLDAFAVTCVLYAVAPTHLISAHVNVARIEHGEYTPILHMFKQSEADESATALLPLLSHDDIRVRQGVAVLLTEKRESLRTELSQQTSFRQHDLLERRVLASLDEATPDMDRVLGDADKSEARNVLFEMARAANNGASWEEIFSISPASSSNVRSGRSQGYVE